MEMRIAYPVFRARTTTQPRPSSNPEFQTGTPESSDSFPISSREREESNTDPSCQVPRFLQAGVLVLEFLLDSHGVHDDMTVVVAGSWHKSPRTKHFERPILALLWRRTAELSCHANHPMATIFIR